MSTTIFNKEEADFDPESMIQEDDKQASKRKKLKVEVNLNEESQESQKDIEVALQEADKALSVFPPLPVVNLNNNGINQETVEAEAVPLDLYYKGKFKTRFHVVFLECEIGIYSFSFEVLTERKNFQKLFALMSQGKTVVFKNPIVKQDTSEYVLKNVSMKNTEKNLVLLTIHTDRR